MKAIGALPIIHLDYLLEIEEHKKWKIKEARYLKCRSKFPGAKALSCLHEYIQ